MRQGSTSTDARQETPDHGKWLSALIALLGTWLIVEAVLFDLVASQFWNDVLVGAVLVAVGWHNYSLRADGHFGNVGAAALAAAVGLWLVVSSFVLGTDAGASETATDLGFWNDVVIGLLAVVLGTYSVYRTRDRRRSFRTTRI